jgi:hypothetical protein
MALLSNIDILVAIDSNVRSSDCGLFNLFLKLTSLLNSG